MKCENAEHLLLSLVESVKQYTQRHIQEKEGYRHEPIQLAGSLAAALALGLTGCGQQQEECDAKPVIYLYPEQQTAVAVSLDD